MPIFPDQSVPPTIVGRSVSLEFKWIGGPNAKYEVLILSTSGTPIAKSVRLDAAKACQAMLCSAVVSWVPGSQVEFTWAVTTFDAAGKAFRSIPQWFGIPKR